MHLSTILPLFLASLISATHLRITVPSSTTLPHPSTLPPSTHATLTTLSHNYYARLRADETFDFPNVTSGSYLLDVHCHTRFFAPLRVDVHESLAGRADTESTLEEVQVWGTFRGNEWDNKGEVMPVSRTQDGNKEVFGFEVRVGSVKDYYIQKQGFSPLSLLKNPMILIAGASMLLVFGMPYIMDNMDPEMKAEFEERQKGSSITGNPAANPLQNFDAAAWLAGSSSASNKRSDVAAPVERGVTR